MTPDNNVPNPITFSPPLADAIFAVTIDLHDRALRHISDLKKSELKAMAIAIRDARTNQAVSVPSDAIKDLQNMVDAINALNKIQSNEPETTVKGIIDLFEVADRTRFYVTKDKRTDSNTGQQKMVERLKAEEADELLLQNLVKNHHVELMRIARHALSSVSQGAHTHLVNRLNSGYDKYTLHHGGWAH